MPAMLFRFYTRLLLCCATTAWAEPIAVTLDTTHGMTRAGQPYFVQGAGGDKQLDKLAARGANSLRTWSTEGLGKILDEAAKLGLTVSVGIWLEPDSSWFSYTNPEHRAKQTERVKKEVMAFRDYPALLAWGLGNECEGEGTNAAFWQQLDALAVLLKSLDSAHPTFTALAGLTQDKATGLNQHAPHLDFIGVNTYGGLFGLRKIVERVGWKRPWMLTEWGPQGYWECRKSATGAPLEQTSTEKASMMARAYDEVIATPQGGSFLGSYAFIWGWKYEASDTWFGLMTQAGDTTASVDVLEERWAKRKPQNTAPQVKPLQGVPTETISPGSSFEAHTNASDAESDAMKWRWAVLPEQGGRDAKGHATQPPQVPGCVPKEAQDHATITAPKKAGNYRLYVWITDGNGHAATANAPFAVK